MGMKASKELKALFAIDDAAKDGVYCVPGDPLDFDLRAAAKYAKEHGIFGITEEVREMFKFKK